MVGFNRGSLQAQGEDISKQDAARINGTSCAGVTGLIKGSYRTNNGQGTISWSWTRTTQPGKKEALAALQCIQQTLNPTQQGNRTGSFQSAVNRIQTAPSTGISAPYEKSWADDPKRDNVRVDIGIYAGAAFRDDNP